MILNDEFMFTFQATLWRRKDYELFLSALLDIPESIFAAHIPSSLRDENQRK
jgi:hypothetical protein